MFRKLRAATCGSNKAGSFDWTVAVMRDGSEKRV
jgi:hypothetical protein